MKKYFLPIMIFCSVILLSFGVSIFSIDYQANLLASASAQEIETFKDEAPNDLTELQKAGDGQLEHWANTLDKFDGREFDYITPARSQGSKNICWAYAAVGAVEANILRNGIDKDVDKTTLDLDETITAYTRHTRDGTQDPLLLTTNDTYYYGRWNQGDSAANAFAIMTQGYALVDENRFHISIDENELKSALKQSKYYVKSYQHFPNTINAIKRAILQYGAVTFNYSGPSSYIYYDPSAWANHTSIIIGWDDTVNSSNFTPKQPNSDGAWIVKNSWGNQDGYNNVNGTYCYYISYELPIGAIEAVEMAMTTDYQNIYHYDGDIAISLNKKAGEAQAAIYEAKLSSPTKQEQLKSVVISVPEDNLDVNIKIYKNLNANPGNVNDKINIPDSGDLATNLDTHVNQSGMHTIDLKSPINLDQGEYFSIVVRCKTKNGASVAVNCAVDNRSINDMTYYFQNGKWINFKNSEFYADSGTDKRTAKIRAITNTIARENIEGNDLKYARVEIPNRLIYYEKDKKLMPEEINVLIDGKLLENEQDYKVKIQNIISPGKTEITIAGNGNYSGTRTTYFEVAKAKYPPGAKSDTINVYSDKKYLKDIPTPVDWKWVDENKKLEYGTNLVSMMYVGEDKDFYQNITCELYVNKFDQSSPDDIDISTVDIEIIGDYFYTGEPIVPSVEVKYKNIELNYGIDYTLTFQNNKNAGVATVVVEGSGHYFGKISKIFVIQKVEKPNVDTTIFINQTATKLSDIPLPDGFVWEDSEMEITSSRMIVKANYIGEDADNYVTKEIYFEIIIEKQREPEFGISIWLLIVITVAVLIIGCIIFVIIKRKHNKMKKGF